MPWGKSRDIGSHVNASGERVYDSNEKPPQQIPHQSGNCKNYEDHNFVVVGTTTVGGVELKKVECRRAGCDFKTTVPAT